MSFSTLEDYISVYMGVLSPEQCAHLIAHFDNHPEGRYLGSMRTPTGPAVDVSLKHVEQLDIAYGTPEDTMIARAVQTVFHEYAPSVPNFPHLGSDDEGYHIKRYAPEEHFYDWHVDADVPWSAGRLVTVLFYLNDVEEGGETEFKWGFKVNPERGKAIVFPANFMYPHRALKPVSGPKYIVNTFVGFP